MDIKHNVHITEKHLIEGKNMNIMYVIYGSIGLGVVLLLSNFIDFSYIISKFLFRSSVKTNSIVNQQKEFLELVQLWYQLKEKCNTFKLDIASEKLDEVFPLLNGVLENEHIS